MEDAQLRPVPEAESPEAAEEASADVAAGRRLALAMESLGEALATCDMLPPGHLKLAQSLATGRSVVPADGEDGGFVVALRMRLAAAEGAAQPGDAARSLVAWLGAEAAAWLGAGLDRVPSAVELLGLREAVELCRDARLDLLDLHRGAAEAHATWYAAGLDAHAARAFTVASAMALEQAVDRWVGLGCAGSLGRYVVTWQRASAGWAERHLGRSVDVDASDLGRLRAMREVLDELRRRRAPRKLIPRMLAERLGVSLAESNRLMQVEAAVTAHRDTRASLSRRWPLVRPVADAARKLGTRLMRAPTVAEIAAEAAVHPALVELILESLDDG
jgi:hypothetical protein